MIGIAISPSKGGLPIPLAYAEIVENTSPQMFWKLDETSGLTAVDDGALGNDLAFNRNVSTMGTQVGSHDNTAPIFATASNDAAHGVLTGYTPSGGGSVMVWINQDLSPATTEYYINAAEDVNNFFYIRKNASNSIRFVYNPDAAFAGTAVSFSGSGWNSIIMTWEENAGKTDIKAYINGTEVVSMQSPDIFALGGSISDFQIGASSDAGASAMNGALDYVALWNRVLSAGEIASLS